MIRKGYKHPVTIISVLSFPIIVLMFVDEGVFWGLLSIAIAILALGIPSYWTYKHRSGAFKDTLDFLNRLFLFRIDEKIAMLDGYISDAPNWKAKSEAVTERISSDLTSLSRMKTDISTDQRIKINEKVIRLVKIMSDNGLDTAKIKAVSALLK
jgi:hypothetical protein